MHRLTDAEFQTMRDKGLCFCCNEKYYAGHRCNVREKRELRTLVLRENGVGSFRRGGLQRNQGNTEARNGGGRESNS